LDNFDDRYLGAKASDPALDNDGNALLLGALYFNTTDGVMKVYTASGWIAASSASVATLATFEFVATAGQTVFSGNDANGNSLSYVAPALIVTLNGVRLRPGDDYTATNGTSITLISAAALNDELVVDAFGSFLVANTYTIAEVDAFAVKLTGNQSIAGNKNFAGNTLYVDDTNDRVGVGIATPVSKLQVDTNTAMGTGSATSDIVTVTNQNAVVSGVAGDKIGIVMSAMSDLSDRRVGLYCVAGNANFNNPDFALFQTGQGIAFRETFRVKADSGNLQFNSGYGSVATAYGCRAWGTVKHNTTIVASGNLSSASDIGGGGGYEYLRFNLATAMPDSNYAIVTGHGGFNRVYNEKEALGDSDGWASHKTSSYFDIDIMGTNPDVNFYYAIFR
jgi:hypothetical protein